MQNIQTYEGFWDKFKKKKKEEPVGQTMSQQQNTKDVPKKEDPIEKKKKDPMEKLESDIDSLLNKYSSICDIEIKKEDASYPTVIINIKESHLNKISDKVKVPIKSLSIEIQTRLHKDRYQTARSRDSEESYFVVSSKYLRIDSKYYIDDDKLSDDYREERMYMDNRHHYGIHSETIVKNGIEESIYHIESFLHKHFNAHINYIKIQKRQDKFKKIVNEESLQEIMYDFIEISDNHQIQKDENYDIYTCWFEINGVSVIHQRESVSRSKSSQSVDFDKAMFLLTEKNAEVFRILPIIQGRLSDLNENISVHVTMQNSSIIFRIGLETSDLQQIDPDYYI